MFRAWSINPSRVYKSKDRAFQRVPTVTLAAWSRRQAAVEAAEGWF
jgi:hypothetical protein